jgi:hypothetical protein
MTGEAALQRFLERGDLLAQRALGEICEQLGVMGPAASASSISRADTAGDEQWNEKCR